MALIKVKHDTHVMTESEHKFWQHALSGDPLIGDFLRKQAMHGVDARERAMNQPVCPKCERFAFHHGSGIVCPSCGYEGVEKTHKLAIHLRDGFYK
jgi:ribosomal protein S27AE